MSLIHNKVVNRIARVLVTPFKKIIPPKYHFAIDGTLKLKLTEGRSMLFHGNFTSNFLRIFFWKGFRGFEYNEYKVFVPLIKKSNVFFDIGANVGYYSLVAKIFNPKIEVHAFEPMPAAKKYFQINMELNHLSGIKVYPIALTNYTGEAVFHGNKNPRFPEIEDHLYGDNSLDEKATGNISRFSIQVKTDTLDNFVKQHLGSQKIDLMKLDTESTEYLVLQGGAEVLQTHRPIIMCEVIKDFHESEMKNLMQKFNYDFYEVTETGLKKVSDLIVPSGKIDYFFVPIEKHALISDLLTK